MKRVTAALVGALFLIPMAAAPAHAGVVCHWMSVQKLIGGKVVITSKKVCVVTTSHVVAVGAVPANGTASDAACAGAAAALHTDPASVCPAAHAEKTGQPGPAQIAAAVWRLRLPASALHIQPVKGRTLVNLATNFYATNAPIERTVTLLGHRIRVRVWASRYAWRFGDGGSRTTTSAGAPYPNLLVTHRYRRKGAVRASLSTVYVAEYRLGQQAWRPVPGSASIASPAQRLEVVTATPRLTDPYG